MSFAYYELTTIVQLFLSVSINIRVIPNAKRNVVSEEGGIIKVWVTAPAMDGRANKAVIGLLADFFKVKKSKISIVGGTKSRDKSIKIIKA